MRISTYIIEFLVFTFVAYILLNPNLIIDVVAAFVTLFILFLVFMFMKILRRPYRRHGHRRRVPWWGNQGPNGPYERRLAGRGRQYSEGMDE